jgi:hypothetical protein
LSLSAIKKRLLSVVETSKACGLLIASSAPLIERQLLTCLAEPQGKREDGGLRENTHRREEG